MGSSKFGATSIKAQRSYRSRVTLPRVTKRLFATGVPGQAPDHVRSSLLVLALSVLGISLAAPLVRLSAAPALVIAAWRLGLSLIMIAGILTARGEWGEIRRVSRADVVLTAGAGVFLAVHFWSWNQSLRYTTVAASVSLVNLQPVIIAIASARWLKEPANGRQWVGIAIAVIGALVVGLSDIPGGLTGIGSALAGGDSATGIRPHALLGDFLALVGAIAGALYYVIGRRVRQTLSVWPYVAMVYGAAFIACVVLALGSGLTIAPQPTRELLIFAALALGPTMIGHTGMNWALGHLPAYLVNLTTLGEPVGATFLAAVLPGIAEVPGLWTVAGGALVLSGVLLAVRRR